MSDTNTHERPLADLNELLSIHEDAYKRAAPIPHCSIDGLVSDRLLSAVLDEWPGENDEWRRTESAGKSEGKQVATDVDEQFGPHTRSLFNALAAPSFLRFLESLTGIEGLIPDPYLHAGGLHEIRSGGYLDIHSDFAFHPRLRLHRRVNVIVYMNRDWAEEYGGHLELWDADMTGAVAKFLPVWNRTVISDVLPEAYHGFPDPISCPESMSRKSLAAWYYSAARPQEEIDAYRLNMPAWKERRAQT